MVLRLVYIVVCGATSPCPSFLPRYVLLRNQWNPFFLSIDGIEC